jgi:hypothetical protein
MAREFDPGRDELIEHIRASDVGSDRRIAEDGIQALAHGALACPQCNLPVWAGSRLPAGAPIDCPFCLHTARAREFFVRDVYDTVGNEVYVIARLVRSRRVRRSAGSPDRLRIG